MIIRKSYKIVNRILKRIHNQLILLYYITNDDIRYSFCNFTIKTNLQKISKFIYIVSPFFFLQSKFFITLKKKIFSFFNKFIEFLDTSE